MSEVLLECRQLVKTYSIGRFKKKKVQALRGVNLSVRRGDVYGFLGENGAGKTTTIRCLIGLTQISGGSICVLGETNPRPEFLFKKISYCPEESNFFTGLTAVELLSIYGRLNGLSGEKLQKGIKESLQKVGLLEAGGRRISGYSKGMRQRVGLAQAILPDPEIIILDEPARGLDPIGRRQFRDVINEYAANGTTFFINSHTLSEVERTCNRIGIIKDGKVIKELAPNDLSQGQSGLAVKYQIDGAPIGDSVSEDRQWVLRVPDTASLSEAVAEIARRGGTVESVTPFKVSLEDYFIKVVGEEEVI
jgi:ABC-2 type transport system ATP-binding protein